MKLIDKDALSMELMNEVLNAYAKADFRFAHALNVFQGLIDKSSIITQSRKIIQVGRRSKKIFR